MRARVTAACAVGMFVVGCGPTNPGPSLVISPSGSDGTLAISGPTDFTATLVNTDADVTWVLESGSPGTLSANTGMHTLLVPPTGTATETLSASADGLTATVTISSGPETLTGATIPGLTAPVTVEYDAQDIPHINCAQAIDCFAVQGYIQARDRFFPMDFLRHVARSNLSELIGLDGLSQDVELRTLFITRAGHRLEDDLAASMDPSTAAVLTAFTGGINAYLTKLRVTPTVPMGGEYAQLPYRITPADIADWTTQDTWAMARLQQFELSETLDEESGYGQFAAVYAAGPLADGGKMTAWIRAAAPPTEQAHTLAPTGFTPAVVTAPSKLPASSLGAWSNVLASTHSTFEALRARLRPVNSTVGSNNWVVSGAFSKTGVSMVANDPHLALQYPPLFHLSVMTSANAADNLDLAGGAFPGIPGALVGRGAHVGWGVTVVGYDVTDVYLEQFLPQTSCLPSGTPLPCVLFNGVPTATLPILETYMVRVGPGPSGLVDATTLGLPGSLLPLCPGLNTPCVLIVPQHGPLVQAPDAGGHAVSARWTGQEGNTQDLRGILGLNTATSVDAAMAALTYFSTGAQNFVLADDAGHIAYDPHALVPVRQFADVTLHPTNPIPPWFPVPGDGTAEWGDGTSNCASATMTPLPSTCWIADSALPQGKDPAKGYFFTANSDPTYPSVSDDNNPLAHPPYLSFDWDDSSGFRATRIDSLLAAAIAANGTVSLDDMEAVQSDHVSRPGMVFVNYIDALPVSSDPDLTAARAILDQWAMNGYDCPSGLLGSDPNESPVDTTPAVVQDSAGCFLFHEFGRILLNNVFTDDLAVARQGVDGLQAIKAMIYMMGLPDGDPGAKFCNDVDGTGATVATHTCSAQVEAALVQGYDTLVGTLGAQPSDWVWGRYHTMQPVPLLALVTTNYEPGPFARPGGLFTVDVGAPSLTASGLDFSYTAAGNVRHISLMDPATPVIKMQLPGPERDGPYLNVGPNLLGQWVLNQYFDFAYGTQQTGSAAVSTQTFSAQ
jgi:penicillin G amidase